MKPAARPLRWLWAAIGVLILLTPIGALAPGTAWGEWGGEELKAAIGYAPADLERLGGLWRSAMPGYATPGISNALLGYLIAAVVGTALTVGVAFAVGTLLARRGEASPPEEPSGTRRRKGRGRSLARKTADSVARAVADVLQNEALAARPGLLQRLDPRIKLLTLVLFAVTATLVHSVWVLTALIGVTIVLAAASRVGVASFERRVWLSAGLLAFLVAAPSALRIFTPGTVVVSLGPLSLTEQGRQEALAGGQILRERGFTFDIAYTSVLKRAIRTLNIIQEEMDLEWIPVVRAWQLNERHYGALQGLNKTEMAVKYGEEQVKIWRRSYDVPPPALELNDERHPRFDRRYADLTSAQLPATESLKITLERVLPYWHSILAPMIKSGKEVTSFINILSANATASAASGTSLLDAVVGR